MICGIDLDFTALKGKLEELKTSAMAEINSTVAAAKAAAQAKMDAFESTIRGWVDELPDIPASEGTPMLAELQSLASDIKALESMVGAELDAATKALALKRAEFEKKFSDALKKAGADLDSLVSGLNDGIDPCSLVPNILTKPDGTVAEVPKEPLYAKDDSLEETPSTETAEMVAVRGKVADDLSVTMASMAASSALVESKLDTIPEKKAQRADILKSQAPDDYYVKTKELEKIDKEVADATTKHPSTELTSFTDTKREENTDWIGGFETFDTFVITWHLDLHDGSSSTLYKVQTFKKHSIFYSSAPTTISYSDPGITEFDSTWSPLGQASSHLNPLIKSVWDELSSNPNYRSDYGSIGSAVVNESLSTDSIIHKKYEFEIGFELNVSQMEANAAAAAGLAAENLGDDNDVW